MGHVLPIDRIEHLLPIRNVSDLRALYRQAYKGSPKLDTVSIDSLNDEALFIACHSGEDDWIILVQIRQQRILGHVHWRPLERDDIGDTIASLSLHPGDIVVAIHEHACGDFLCTAQCFARTFRMTA